jgi:hypothetical protein
VHPRFAHHGVGCTRLPGRRHVEEELLQDFPELTREDIRACLAFAADRERRLVAPDVR